MFASSFPRVFDTLSQYDLTSPLLMFLFCRCHDLVADWWIVVVAARLLMLGFGMQLQKLDMMMLMAGVVLMTNMMIKVRILSSPPPAITTAGTGVAVASLLVVAP